MLNKDKMKRQGSVASCSPSPPLFPNKKQVRKRPSLPLLFVAFAVLLAFSGCIQAISALQPQRPVPPNDACVYELVSVRFDVPVTVFNEPIHAFQLKDVPNPAGCPVVENGFYLIPRYDLTKRKKGNYEILHAVDFQRWQEKMFEAVSSSEQTLLFAVLEAHYPAPVEFFYWQHKEINLSQRRLFVYA